MLTAVQRAEILRFAPEPEPDPSTTTTDDDIWYGFLSSLFAAGRTLKDLKLSRAQHAEIMACLRRAPSVAPRTFNRGRERLVRSSPSPAPTSD